MNKTLGLALAALLMSACTASKPPPYQPLDVANIIPGQEIVVRANENVYTIARKNNVNMREIIALNNLQPPFTIKAGQHLVLPAKRGADSGVDYAPVPSSAPAGHIDTVPLSGGAVQAEPLKPIASAPVSSAPLTSPSQGSVSKAPLSSSNVSSTDNEKLPSNSPFGVGPSVPDPQPVAGDETAAPAPSAAANETSSASEAALPVGQFSWPVQGTVVSGFGSKNGVNNDGVNIAAPKGSPVIASAGGIVAYTGNEMKGFGNLILIRHEGGWVTAYAHLERMAVSKDSVVAPGDMIGTVGTTGGLTSPQLHFEARKDGTPVDPMTVLKK